MRNMLIWLKFGAVAATAEIEAQVLEDLEGLRSMSDTRIDRLCSIVSKPREGTLRTIS